MVILNQLDPTKINYENQLTDLITEINSLLDRNILIQQVFFYGPAVLQAHKSIIGQVTVQAWRAVANRGVDLCVCPNSAIHRQVYDSSLAAEYSAEITMIDCFKIGSLAQFFACLADGNSSAHNNSNKLLFIISHNIARNTIEFSEILDIILFAASLDWQVKLYFKNKAGELFFEDNKEYLTDLFAQYDMNNYRIYHDPEAKSSYALQITF